MGLMLLIVAGAVELVVHAIAVSKTVWPVVMPNLTTMLPFWKRAGVPQMYPLLGRQVVPSSDELFDKPLWYRTITRIALTTSAVP